ncbi:hypothetical protein HDU67_005745 [Dinochytrium kinnereticum]|nr:hypothetical protein HDU67_005745 [Dinochytrium kinnereticum]
MSTSASGWGSWLAGPQAVHTIQLGLAAIAGTVALAYLLAPMPSSNPQNASSKSSTRKSRKRSSSPRSGSSKSPNKEKVKAESDKTIKPHELQAEETSRSLPSSGDPKPTAALPKQAHEQPSGDPNVTAEPPREEQKRPGNVAFYPVDEHDVQNMHLYLSAYMEALHYSRFSELKESLPAVVQGSQPSGEEEEAIVASVIKSGIPCEEAYHAVTVSELKEVTKVADDVIAEPAKARQLVSGDSAVNLENTPSTDTVVMVALPQQEQELLGSLALYSVDEHDVQNMHLYRSAHIDALHFSRFSELFPARVQEPEVDVKEEPSHVEEEQRIVASVVTFDIPRESCRENNESEAKELAEVADKIVGDGDKGHQLVSGDSVINVDEAPSSPSGTTCCGSSEFSDSSSGSPVAKAVFNPNAPAFVPTQSDFPIPVLNPAASEFVPNWTPEPSLNIQAPEFVPIRESTYEEVAAMQAEEWAMMEHSAPIPEDLAYDFSPLAAPYVPQPMFDAQYTPFLYPPPLDATPGIAYPSSSTRPIISLHSDGEDMVSFNLNTVPSLLPSSHQQTFHRNQRPPRAPKNNSSVRKSQSQPHMRSSASASHNVPPPTLGDFIEARIASAAAKTSTTTPAPASVTPTSISNTASVPSSSPSSSRSSFSDEGRPTFVSAPVATLPMKAGGRPGNVRRKDIVKCIFGPSCANANSGCPYYHANEICKFYPDCKYGNSCIFVHKNAATA